MFPIRWNFPFRKKDGKMSTIQDELDNSGGGSEVEITPILTEGTKIATFEIDGEEGDLYAPEASSGGCTVVDIITRQNYDSGTRTDEVSLSDLITEEDFNTYLKDHVIFAVNPVGKPNIHLGPVSGSTYSDIKMTWYAKTSSMLSGGTHLKFLIY